MNEGIIISLNGGIYSVLSAGEIYECKARGIFRNIGVSPVPGDECFFSDGVISKIKTRKNLLLRPAVANVDNLCIVASTTEPAPNFKIIDMLTAECEIQGIEPIIIITKNDLKDGSDIIEIYEKSGYYTFSSNFKSKEIPQEFYEKIKNKINVFTGNSGAGKSTFLNMLCPNLDLATNEISQKLHRGRHTTRMTELFEFEGGFIADTPGFSSIDIKLSQNLDCDNLALGFRDFSDYIGKCKFRNCSHISEKGCAIIEAVNLGKIEKSRHESYKTMFNELKTVNPWEKKQKAK